MADASEKTEAPTPRRLEQARKDGEVWQPKEMSPAVAMVTGALLLTVGGGAAWATLTRYLAAAPSDPGAEMGLASVARAPAGIGIGAAGAAAVAAIATGLAVSHGANWLRLTPKFGRLNPIAGLGRIVSKDGAMAAGLAVLKLAVLATTGFALFRPELPHLLRLDGSDWSSVAAAVSRLTLFAAVALGLIAAAEGWSSFRSFRAKLRMSPDDIRRERRQDDGAPELKAQIRKAQITAASRRMKKTLAEATVVVVNPAHFAIALRYRPGVDAAPVLVEKGREITAAAIRAVAAEFAIPIVRAPRLARAVYFTGRIGDTVREELFGAVAIVIAYVLSFDAPDAPPSVAVPRDFDFDETGARRKPGTPAPL